MKKFPIPPAVRSFAETFHRLSHSLYIVGGAVRDFYAGRPVKDFDFATDARPQQVQQMFRRTIPTGIDHGTVTVLYREETYEVTTFRAEEGYSDARHPDGVAFIGTIEEDLERRDFTINALAVDTRTGKLTDLHGGIADLGAGLIRTVGNPDERFREDSLRMLRAFRFSALLNFEIEQQTLGAVGRCAPQISRISAERIQEELSRLLTAAAPSRALLEMERIGLLEHILPELTACRGFGSKGPFELDLFSHLVCSCDAAPARKPVVRWAALLHDIGKPAAEVIETDQLSGDQTIHYHGHELIGAELAEGVLRRLKYPNDFVRKTGHLIRHHMFNYSPQWGDAAVRRFIHTVGWEACPDLIALRKADIEGSAGRKTESDPILKELEERAEKIVRSEAALQIRDLAVNGTDLMAAGIPQGPIIGTVLKQLLETVLDDPEQNNREQLLKIAMNIYRLRLS